MKAVSPSSPHHLKPMLGASPATARMALGSSRAEWQSTCAIIASKVVSQEQSESAAELPPLSGGADHVAAVNGHNSAATVAGLNLVPIEKSDAKSLVPQPPQKPLSITDLSPAPMHGSKLRVAYQGVPGAYSEAAAGKAYPNCEAIPCDQFEVAFQAVELWIADRAVLPVENSLGGSIHRNYDLLLRHRLHIVGEVQLPVHHCLMALPGIRKEFLTRVISHPQGLAQCEHTLTKLGLNVAREAVDDTAGAAEFIAANNLRDTAAIASARAAEIYGLEILEDGIQDDASNVTRFVMLARDPIIPRTDRPFKTSIVFAHEKGTSVLFKVLSAFAFRNISLTKIESRPNHNRPIRLVDDANVGTAKHFEYMFYIDFEASMAEPRAQNALAEVQEFTSFLRVLGSYPMDMTPWSPSSSSSSSLSASSPS
ncbi:PREDICTED: arogenate dehydratase/prephenate dehydratase 6, chloroplastic isoform X2 [Tarenaya hassleriana]|uniref:arogenate dehydratase/prephenate dehydratase 6, chloroplastic isoform X2 n=1 Tax=Tarenaya hassleriana TaxID=28532 RepID=UPI0008FD6EDC|nr:PREDICTED: arogenate dehydratase/prephenate dehydratase 6, chloroplastic isoform X2 [Tarenaya hassleriana]